MSTDAPSQAATDGWALFDTAIGACAIAWGPAGLTGALLPDADAARTRARMRRRFAGVPECDPPVPVADWIAAMQAVLRGEVRGEAAVLQQQLASLPIDWTGVPDFHRRVYAATRALPPGRTLTYGDMARQLGDAGAARAVGQALGANPFAPFVPCHRVLGAAGWHGGFSAPGGVDAKRRMLLIEDARPDDQPTLF